MTESGARSLALNMEEVEILMTGDGDESDGDSAWLVIEKLNSDQRDRVSTIETMAGDANVNDDDDTVVEKPNSDQRDYTSTSNKALAAGGDDKFDVNSILQRLLEVRGSRPGKNVQLTEAEISGLCLKSREIFLSQPILLELEGPLKICGDIHGQYYDLLRLFEYGGFPPDANYLFLGNYVDFGMHSLETICLLLVYKIKYLENFFLLRGNHECASINHLHGFYDECKRRYNIRLWKTVTDCFNCLPVAAIIDEKLFCCHGGLSPDFQSMEQIRGIMHETHRCS